MSLTFLDLFAGIGGFRLGLEQAGHRCLGHVEWDKFARKSYEAIHNTKGEWSAHDITTVTDDDIRLFRGRVDIIAGGFPCQAFSVAGHRKGFEDTRGTLFFEIARFASIIKPRYLFLENVKGLLNHDGGNTFGTILRALDELGYDAEWQVLNSKDFGVPQNRERLFIIGHLRGSTSREIFPINGTSRTFIEPYEQTQGKGKWVFPTVYTKAHRGDAPYVYESGRLRVVTEKEAWRLQGFPDWAFDRAIAVNSESQVYKQAGNSVTVNVVYEIAKRF